MKRGWRGPWWLQQALLAGVLAIVAAAFALFPDSQHHHRLIFMGAGMVMLVTGLRLAQARLPSSEAPWTRLINTSGRRGKVDSVKRIADGVAWGWRGLVALVWFGLMVAATPNALQRWLDGDSSEAGVVVIVGVVLVVIVIAAIAIPIARRSESKRITREAAVRAAASGAFAPVVRDGGSIAAAAPPAQETPAARRGRRAERMLGALGADPAQIEQSVARRRAKLLAREQRRAQRAVTAGQADADRASANRALGRD